jgi:lipopolysaccharide export system permease protein
MAVGRILDRYIFREVATTWLGVTAVLLVILLTNQVARVLDRAAEGQFPRSVVLELIALSALQNLPVLVPVGLLLGVVLAFGRMYHDSEMAAVLSCGVSPARLFVPVAAVTLVLAAFMAWLAFQAAPAAANRALALRGEAVRAGQFAPIAAGQFRSFGGGSTVVYAQSAAGDGSLERVFVRRLRDGRYEIAVAQRATHTISADGSLHTLTLYDGERHEGVPGQGQFRILRFSENVIPVRIPGPGTRDVAVEARSTAELRDSTDLEWRAEYHWRVALPAMTLVLAFLAVAPARRRPRQGRYARVWLAVVAYFLYISLVSAAKVWIMRGTVPEVLGLWWVHVAVIIVTLAALAVPGWRARLRHRDAMVPA